jgi:hypothetical protein
MTVAPGISAAARSSASWLWECAMKAFSDFGIENLKGRIRVRRDQS